MALVTLTAQVDVRWTRRQCPLHTSRYAKFALLPLPLLPSDRVCLTKDSMMAAKCHDEKVHFSALMSLTRLLLRQWCLPSAAIIALGQPQDWAAASLYHAFLALLRQEWLIAEKAQSTAASGASRNLLARYQATCAAHVEEDALDAILKYFQSHGLNVLPWGSVGREPRAGVTGRAARLFRSKGHLRLVDIVLPSSPQGDNDGSAPGCRYEPPASPTMLDDVRDYGHDGGGGNNDNHDSFDEHSADEDETKRAVTGCKSSSPSASSAGRAAAVGSTARRRCDTKSLVCSGTAPEDRSNFFTLFSLIREGISTAGERSPTPPRARQPL